MKKEAFIVILFIFSLYFLVPLAKPEVTITAIPETPTEETFRFQSPKLFFRSEINDLVLVNVTFLDLLTNTSEIVHLNQQFVGEISLDLPKSGFYSITIFSSSLGLISIKEIGIAPIGLAFFSLTLLLNIVLVYRKIQEFML